MKYAILRMVYRWMIRFQEMTERRLKLQNSPFYQRLLNRVFCAMADAERDSWG